MTHESLGIQGKDFHTENSTSNFLVSDSKRSSSIKGSLQIAYVGQENM